MNRGGFSWKRFLGVSAAKSRISRRIGIPLTRSGRQRKVGAAFGGLGGFLFLLLFNVIARAFSGPPAPPSIIVPRTSTPASKPPASNPVKILSKKEADEQSYLDFLNS